MGLVSTNADKPHIRLRCSDTRRAMQATIDQALQCLPFDTDVEIRCTKRCAACAKKLLKFLRREFDHWQFCLDRGDTPTEAQVNDLSAACWRIYHKLVSMGVQINH